MEVQTNLNNENAERILKEGWRLFEQKGFLGVSLDELCLRTGLSKPTVYYYFHNKENLFVQVLHYKLRGFHAVIEHSGTLTERLERFAANILASFKVETNVMMRNREHIKRPEALQEIKEAFHIELFGPLIRLMRMGIDQGELEGDNPEMLTLIFLGSINNFIGKSSEMHMSNTDLAKILTRYFLEGAKNE